MSASSAPGGGKGCIARIKAGEFCFAWCRCDGPTGTDADSTLGKISLLGHFCSFWVEAEYELLAEPETNAVEAGFGSLLYDLGCTPGRGI